MTPLQPRNSAARLLFSVLFLLLTLSGCAQFRHQLPLSVLTHRTQSASPVSSYNPTPPAPEQVTHPSPDGRMLIVTPYEAPDTTIKPNRTAERPKPRFRLDTTGAGQWPAVRSYLNSPRLFFGDTSRAVKANPKPVPARPQRYVTQLLKRQVGLKTEWGRATRDLKRFPRTRAGRDAFRKYLNRHPEKVTRLPSIGWN